MATRRYIYVLTGAIVAGALSVFCAPPAAAREVYNINARWTFFTGNDTDTGASSVIYLPHTWNSDATAAGGAGYYRGTGNYLKDMDIPAEWEGRRVFLRIGGAETVTDVFINSHHAAGHYGGAAAFTTDITDRLLWGRTNSFRIVVNNSPRFDVLPTAGEENVYGGIYRDVEIIVCDPLSISPAVAGGAEDGITITTDRLTADKAEGKVSLTLLDTPLSTPENTIARVRFFDGEENIVAQNTVPVRTGELTLPFTVTKPRLWQGTADPHLYNVEVMLLDSMGMALDSLRVKTGFRTVGIGKGNDFLLNGKPLRLRGVILHRDRMMVGTALTPFQIEEDVRLIREMGANAVRVAGGRHSDYFYELCDQAGLVVWNDGPFTGRAWPTDIDFVDTPQFRENGRAQLTEMIAQLRNHPCVAIWGIFSNVSTLGDDPVPYIRQLNDLAHTLDPGRLTAGSSVQDGDINFVTDMVSFDRSFGWGGGLPDGIVPWLTQLRRSWPGLHAGLSYSAGASIFHQSALLEKTVPESNHHPEGWQTFFHEQYMLHAVDAPGLWGVFVGNMFDFGSARNVWGDGRGTNDHGLVTFDRKDRKDAFYVYKANWNSDDPFVYISGGRLNQIAERRRDIRVYSNRPEVELFVSGRSQGRRGGEKGVFVWENVGLRNGVNNIEVRAAGTQGAPTVSDRITITQSTIPYTNRPAAAATITAPAATATVGAPTAIPAAIGMPATE